MLKLTTISRKKNNKKNTFNILKTKKKKTNMDTPNTNNIKRVPHGKLIA